MIVAATFLTVNLEYVPGLGEEIYDTRTKKTYKGDSYTPVKFLVPLDSGGGGGSNVAADIDYDNTTSGMTADNVQAALDEAYLFAVATDTELNNHLVDTTAHTAEQIVYNPALAGGVTSINVQGAIDQHLLDTTAHSATNIPFTPTPSILSNNVQAAIVEIDADIQAILAGGIVEAVDVSFVPVGAITAINVQLAIAQAEAIASTALNNAGTANTNINAHLVDTLEAHTASAIKYTNSGVILDAFDVQDALDTLAATVNSGAVAPPDDSITNAKLANMAPNSIKGNNTGALANPVDLTTTQVKSLLAIASTDVSGLGTLATQNTVNLNTQATGTLQAAQEPAHTGDVTNTAASLALTIAADAVTNPKLANMAQNTIKGRATAGTNDPEDLTPTQARAVIASDSGGGIVNFLRADGIWAAPPNIPTGGAANTFLKKNSATDFDAVWAAPLASQIVFSPVGTIAATNVQAAIAEILTDIDKIETGTYTPTLTNIVIGTGGSAANTADYIFIGGQGVGAVGLLRIMGKIVLGTTGQSMGSAPKISIPPGFSIPTAQSSAPLGFATYNDAGTATIHGVMRRFGTTSLAFFTNTILGSFVVDGTVAATGPMTWVAGDGIFWVAGLQVTRV